MRCAEFGSLIEARRRPVAAPAGRRFHAGHRRRGWFAAPGIGVVLAALLPAPAISGSEGQSDAPVDHTRARHVLKVNCQTCHNPEKRKGGLDLTTRDAVMRGGDGGAVVVAGEPEESPLIALLAAGADPHMPPKKQLAEAQIGWLSEWIRAGMPWDGAGGVAGAAEIRPVALAPLPAGYRPVMAMAVSPDGRRLAAGCGADVAVFEIEADTLRLRARAAAHFDPVQSIAWTPDGKRLVTGAFRRVMIWNADTLTAEREVMSDFTDRITAVRVLPGGGQALLADGLTGEQGVVRMLDLESGAVARSWVAHGDTIFDLALSADGAVVATAGGDGLVRLWEVAGGVEIARLEAHATQVLGVAFDGDGTRLATAGADRQLRVWDVKTRENIVALAGKPSAFNAVAWAADGAVVAATDEGALFRYTDLKAHTGAQSSETGNERGIGRTEAPVLCLAVDGSGGRLFAGASDGRVLSWTSDGKELASVDVASAAVAAAPDEPAVPDTSAESDPSDRSDRSDLSDLSDASDASDVSDMALLAEPAALTLEAGGRAAFLVTARHADGTESDVTDAAVVTMSAGEVAGIEEPGVLRARAAGRAVLAAEWGGRRVEIPVSVDPAPKQPPTFVRDVLPVLGRAGCNAGACHAKAEGQNGFRLSVFSFDPASDFREIVTASRGRRIFPAAPDESLLLLKATQQVPHEGGERFTRESDAYRALVRWIRGGLVFRADEEPALTRLEVIPGERRYRKGARQRLIVHAHHADGSVRDVTHLAAFSANDNQIASVNEDGVVSIDQVSGQAVIVARFMGVVGDSAVIVPADRILPADAYAGLPVTNVIDALAYAKFRQMGLLPSDRCSDGEFLRRASLDTIGLLPSAEEARAFLDDPSPDKRRAAIDRLLEHPGYADHWATQWADLLRPNPDRVGVKSVYILDQWLRDHFRRNTPIDQFAREILVAQGNTHRLGPAVVYRDRREPAELTTLFSQIFLGVRLDCAKCHHHPSEKWSQDDFHRFAAFFAPLRQKGGGISTPISGGNETFFVVAGRTHKHPVTGEAMRPQPLDGPPAEFEDGDDPRAALADWLLDPANPFFARAIANRVWSRFFGKGIVDPVDDFRLSNPPSHPLLLDALATELVRARYDVKALMRLIMNSHTYQLSSEPNATNGADTRHFSRAYRRRLGAETMADALADITGVPTAYPGLPPGSRAAQAWTYKIDSRTMDAFGRPNSSSDCPCERNLKPSIGQSLHLMNSDQLHAKLTSDEPGATVQRLATGSAAPSDIVTELYLACYTRFPNDDELAAATAAFTDDPAARRQAIEDVLWSLVNSAEFVFNH